ncbi:MAG: ribosome maturation factor RimM [Dysgonamonadaceae bacterium]|jgi:16S rRNA processing protein RimM|nr:ribosome maturation factor RimM [Dysgonamonadaceae bacterium]
MIRIEELVEVGRFGKPHGTRGEIAFTFTGECFTESVCPFFICCIEGIFVPFMLKESTFRSDNTGIVVVKGLDSSDKVRFLTGRMIYFHKKFLNHKPLDRLYNCDSFTGFTVIDESYGEIGIISAVDNRTINNLFVIDTPIGETLIPVTEDFILSVDILEKTLLLRLPDGML